VFAILITGPRVPENLREPYSFVPNPENPYIEVVFFNFSVVYGFGKGG
jgi:hypothetical protein